MGHVRSRGRSLTAALLALPLLLAAGCGGGDGGGNTGGGGSGGNAGGGGAIPVGIVTTTSGLLGGYGNQYVEGVRAGVDYATQGSNSVKGRPVERRVVDDGGDPAKAISAATGLVGQGVKVLAGTASSGVAVQMAPFAKENDVLYISGPAATDAVTGVNKNTFRSGRQTYQDVATAASLLENVNGKVLVFAQESEFGRGNVAAVKAVLGTKGATVDELLAPLSANEFTPFAQQIKDRKADLLFVAWAGDTTSAMWQALQQQGVFDATTVTTGLGDAASFSAYGKDPQDIRFLAHYFPEAPDNPVNAALRQRAPKADLFTPDGFVAGQMIVRALSEGDPKDTAAMIRALEGWSFDAPKGKQTVRAGDHAMLQPMFTAQLSGEPGSRKAKRLSTLPPEAVAPPAKTP